MANMRQYETDPLVLDTASQLKSCADRKLTDEGRQNTLGVLVGPAVRVCASGACLGAGEGGLLRAVRGGGAHFLSTRALPWEPGRRKSLMNEEVERMRRTRTARERLG